MAFFGLYPELWRSRIDQARGDIPGDFLLAFIKRESNGNPCSFTKLREAGIFQLMAGDNQNVAGTTEAALTSACDPAALAACASSGTSCNKLPARDLTDDEANEQVRSGLQYVQWARAQVHQYSQIPESSPDFWRLVKMIHVAPAVVHICGPTSASWADFRACAAQPILNGKAVPSSWLDNAEWVGGYATGDSGQFIAGMPDWLTFLLGVGSAVAIWKGASWLSKRHHAHAA